MHFGNLLRQARQRRKLSQFELSMRLGVSQRHISFVEGGRARPGRTLLAAWLEELEAPASIRNAILLHAGYSIAQAAPAGETFATAPGLNQLVGTHYPFPAFIFNADWMITDINDAGTWLCSVLMPEYWNERPAGKYPIDILETASNPRGLLSQMQDPGTFASLLLRRLRAEQWARPSLRERLDRLEKELRVTLGSAIVESPAEPELGSISCVFTTPLGRLSFRVLQTPLGLPQNVSILSPRIEHWFPVDEETRRAAALCAHAPT